MDKKVWGNRPQGGSNAAEQLKGATADNPEYQTADSRFIRVRTDMCEPDPTQPRKYFNEETIARRRAQLEDQGQLEPIEVCPPQEPGGKYRIVDGESRWRAAMSSDKESLKYLDAKLFDGDPDDTVTILTHQLIHNNDGSEPLTAMERGLAYRKLAQELEEQGSMTPSRDAASLLKISESMFSEIASLADAPEKVQTFVLEKGLTDIKVVHSLNRVARRGSDELYGKLVSELEEGIRDRAPLRKIAQEAAKQLRNNKPAAPKKAKGKAKAKPSRKLTAESVKLLMREDGTGLLTLETPRESISFNVTQEQIDRMSDKDETQL